MSLRDAVLKAGSTARPMHPVPVPEWVGDDGQPLTVYLKTWSGADQTGFEKACDGDGKKKPDSLDALVLCMTVGLVDHDGAPLFTDADASWLRGQPSKLLVKLCNEIRKINGLSQAEVEGIRKN